MDAEEELEGCVEGEWERTHGKESGRAPMHSWHSFNPPEPPFPLYYYHKHCTRKHFSSPQVLGEDFVAEFRETFSILVVRWPGSVSVQIWEKGLIRDTFVAQVRGMKEREGRRD